MVVIFMLYHMEKEKNKIKISLVYDEIFNDEKKKVRELYIREKIIQDFLFLQSMETDKEKISANEKEKFINVVNSDFFEKFT